MFHSTSAISISGCDIGDVYRFSPRFDLFFFGGMGIPGNQLPLTMPAALHVPCAVDILVVFMIIFSLRFCKLESDACFLYYYQVLECVLAEIGRTSAFTCPTMQGSGRRQHGVY